MPALQSRGVELAIRRAGRRCALPRLAATTPSQAADDHRSRIPEARHNPTVEVGHSLPAAQAAEALLADGSLAFEFDQPAGSAIMPRPSIGATSRAAERRRRCYAPGGSLPASGAVLAGSTPEASSSGRSLEPQAPYGPFGQPGRSSPGCSSDASRRPACPHCPQPRRRRKEKGNSRNPPPGCGDVGRPSPSACIRGRMGAGCPHLHSPPRPQWLWVWSGREPRLCARAVTGAGCPHPKPNHPVPSYGPTGSGGGGRSATAGPNQGFRFSPGGTVITRPSGRRLGRWPSVQRPWW